MCHVVKQWGFRNDLFQTIINMVLIWLSVLVGALVLYLRIRFRLMSILEDLDPLPFN